MLLLLVDIFVIDVDVDFVCRVIRRWFGWLIRI